MPGSFGDILATRMFGLNEDEQTQRRREFDDIVKRNPGLAPTSEDYNRGLEQYIKDASLPISRTQDVAQPETRQNVGPRYDMTNPSGGLPISVLPTTEVKQDINQESMPIQMGKQNYERDQDTGAYKISNLPSGGNALPDNPLIKTPNYSQDQALAMASGDPGQLVKAFPNGVPGHAFDKFLSYVTAKGNASEKKNAHDLTVSTKEDQRVANRITLMGNDLDPEKSKAGNFGIQAQKYGRAEALESLAGAYADGNLDSRQIEELAVGLNALLSGSNTGAARQVEALVPKSAIGNIQKMKEFFMNEPYGTNQQEFVNRMLGSISREKQTALNQLNRTRFSRVSKYEDVAKASPDQWENVLRSNNIDPEEYAAWKKGGYKHIDAVVKGGEGGNPVGGQRGGPPTITSDVEFNALPSGTVFIDGNGQTHKKK